MILTRYLVRYRNAEGEVWLNTLTGAVDSLSAGEASLASGGLATPETAAEKLLQERLISRGYLFADELAEQDAFAKLISDSVENGASRPVNLIVCPTYACNLRCVYCFERLPQGSLPGEHMDAAMAATALGAFRELRDREPECVYALGLFGGEPLLASNLGVVTMVLDESRAAALPLMIVSNGVCAPSFMPLLREYSDCIQALQLTLDGPEDVHDARRPAAGGRGTFAAVAAAVDSCLENGIRVVLRTNIDRDNVGCVPEMAGVIRERGWNEDSSFKCSLAPVKDHLHSGSVPNLTPEAELLALLLDVYDADPSAEELFGYEGFQMLGAVASLLGGERASSPRVYHCEANYGGFRVAGPDGYIYACPESIGQPGLAIGKFDNGLEMWEDRCSLWDKRNIATLAACEGCQIGPLCGGGCAYAALARQSGDSRPDCEPGLIDAIGTLLERRVLVCP